MALTEDKERSSMLRACIMSFVVNKLSLQIFFLLTHLLFQLCLSNQVT